MAKHRTRAHGTDAPELNGVIFVGDLVRAYAALKPTDEATAQQIAEALGFTWRARQLQTETVKELTPEELAERRRILEEQRKRAPIQVQEQKPRVQSSAEWLPGVITAQGKESIAGELGVAALPLERGDSERVPPPFTPLFRPEWTRAILSGALATISPEGALDLERIIEFIAQRKPLETLPRLSETTLRRGAQLLLDQSQAMLPYERDEQELMRAIQNVMGQDKVQILRFAGCPTRGVWKESNVELNSPNEKDWRYAAPPTGTLVLLVSDLGHTRPRLADDWADANEWIAFSEIVKRAGCELAAFVPYAATRWQPKLRGVINMIPWDRRTTAGLAKKFARGQRGGTQ